MYPVNETDHVYADHSHNHPSQSQSYVIQMPSYGMPVQQPYAPPRYISTSSRMITPRTQWSTGLCRCLDDPGICKDRVGDIHSPFFKTHIYYG